LDVVFLEEVFFVAVFWVVADFAAGFLAVVFVVRVFCCADFFVCAVVMLADSSQHPKSRNQKE
jgi:hypothetical protein